MVPLRKSDSYSLQAHDIYFQKRQAVGNCAAEIQNLFKLVIGIKDLNADHFGGYETADPKHAVFPSTILPEFSPRQEYERELKVEADELSITYSDSRRADDNEEKWVQELEPVVFYRFNREREENFICRKHYPISSRPLINRASERSISRRVENKERLKYLNLPNFGMFGQLVYPEFENEGKMIPDRRLVSTPTT
ncbi:hypothetical protein V8E51_005590 [Hyaloscypha variabilis]